MTNANFRFSLIADIGLQQIVRFVPGADREAYHHGLNVAGFL
jgi:hypothetical protein